MSQGTQVSLEKAKDLIYTYDLTPVYNRLVHMKGWRKKHALEAIKQYRNFVYLQAKYPGKTLPPSTDIDEVWHAHILHTKAYHEFCIDIFGGYSHHTPANPLDQAKTTKFTQLFNDNTQELHKLEFGDYLYVIRIANFLKNQLKLCIIKLVSITRTYLDTSLEATQ